MIYLWNLSCCSTPLITSCSPGILLQPEETDSFNQPSYANYLPLSQTDSILYYLNDLGKLYAYESGDSAMEIGSLYYVDDKQIDNQAQLNSSPEKYSDLFLFGMQLQYFSDGLVYASMYDNVEGSIEYHLNHLTKDGKNRHEIMSFPFSPKYFFIHKNNIFVVENTDVSNILHIYDLSGKGIKQISSDDIYNIYGYQNNVFLKTADKLIKIPLDTLEMETVFSGETYVSLYKNQISYYTLENNGETMHSGIKDIENGTVVFTINECIIDYFDETYIYTTSYNEEHTTYRIYNWKQNLIKEIIPYDSLGESQSGAMPIAMKPAEYSTIARVWNHQIIGSCFGKQSMQLFTCDIASGKCKYIVQ